MITDLQRVMNKKLFLKSMYFYSPSQHSSSRRQSRSFTQPSHHSTPVHNVKTNMNMFVIILIMWLILSPVQSCWVRKHSQDDSTECVAALRPNLVHIENQYQGFLGAVRRLNEIAQQRTKTVDFLGQEAVIYTTEYLEEIKDSVTRTRKIKTCNSCTRLRERY